MVEGGEMGGDGEGDEFEEGDVRRVLFVEGGEGFRGVSELSEVVVVRLIPDVFY